MDIETQSTADLRKLGSRAYLRDPSTRLLSAVFLAGKELHVWAPLSRLPRGFDPDLSTVSIAKAFPEYPIAFHTCEHPPRFPGTYVAHNAEAFDALAYERFGYNEGVEWFDTMPMCMASGLPAGLDAVSQALGGPGKDEHGKKAMLLLTRAKAAKNGNIVYPIGTQPLWDLVLRYNVQDVLELKRVYESTVRLREDHLYLHTRVNWRGIPIDRAFARLLKRFWSQLGNEARDAVAELTQGALKEDDLFSAARVKKWLDAMGFKVDSLERKQIDAMIADPEGFFGDTEDPRVALIVQVIHERQQSVRATPGKVDRIFVAADADDRVRGCYRYNAAFTGRFTARDLQPHNFPRGLSDLDVGAILDAYRAGTLDLQFVRDQAAKCGGGIGDALGTLMRPAICAPKGRRLVVGDFGQVEARAVGWFSGDENLLSAFSDPKRDIYCETASVIFGCEVTKADKDKRFIGKTVVLGCGYQMGPPKFGLTARLNGCNLDKAGTSAEECVKAYRTRFSEVPKAWRALGDAFRWVVERSVREHSCCRVTFAREGDNLFMWLPSSRAIIYRDVRIEPIVPTWGGEPRLTPTYRDPRGFRKSVYGGMLMDHICQGTCSDILKECALELERDDLEGVMPQRVCMHVHDELVLEVAEGNDLSALRRLLEVMSTPPSWAADFPLVCEGFVSEHYVKSPLPGFAHGTGRKGVAEICAS